jgi:hypothetical protein
LKKLERDDDNLLAAVPAPLFDLVECMDEDACVDEDEICVLVRDAVACPAALPYPCASAPDGLSLLLGTPS